MTAPEHDGRREHVPGEFRDLPRGQAGYVRPHAPVTKPKGLDWDALTPKCRQCGTPSGQLADGARCPTCRGEQPVDVFAKPGRAVVTAATRSTGVTATYDQLDDDEVAERFTAPTQTPAAATTGEPTAAAGPKTPAAGTGKGKPTRQPATTPPSTTSETTVTSPPFPTYIVDIAVVMRDSEGHHDPAVRAARKTVANALQGLNRELTRVGSPAAAMTPMALRPVAGIRIPPPRDTGRPSKLRPHHTELISRYLAGESTHALAADFGASARGISDYLHKHDIPVRRHGANTSTTNPTGVTA